MTPNLIDVHFPAPHADQQQVLAEMKRFNVIDCGRRWGKDVILTRRTSKKAARGMHVGFFAPTYKMLSENWRTFTNILYPVTKDKSEQEHRIDTISGGVLECWSLDSPDASRGRKYHYTAINEAAMVKSLENAWNNVIRATLADYRGSADFASTPRGLNYFYTLWQQAENNPEWARWKKPASGNPYIPADEIQAIQASVPERVFLQEFLAEFVTDGAYFQGVDQAASILAPEQPEKHAGHFTVAGIDFALSNDYTVITVGCRDCNRVVDWERFNQIDFTYQRERIVSMATRWKCSTVLPERNSIGEPNIELLRERIPIGYGVDNRPGFNTSATTKPALIQGLANAIEHEGFKIPHDYADELRSYEVETMASGHPKFGAPDGQHDDRVISLALCWWAMSRAISPSGLVDGV
jgi:hypothetical protein